MASGDPVIQIMEAIPPAASQAGLRFVTGGSTPAELAPVWLFDDTAAEYLDLLCQLSTNYDGGGLTLSLRCRLQPAARQVFSSAAGRRTVSWPPRL